jgi:hypothetical protein
VISWPRNPSISIALPPRAGGRVRAHRTAVDRGREVTNLDFTG